MGLGMIGLVLAGLVYWGYSQFRHGGVVEEGSGIGTIVDPRGMAWGAGGGDGLYGASSGFRMGSHPSVYPS